MLSTRVLRAVRSRYYSNMRSTAAEALASAVDALAEIDPEALRAAELQTLIARVGPQVDRLSGVLTAAVGALQARTGGTVASSPGRDGTPGPVVAVRHWLRDTLGCGPSRAGAQVALATDLRTLPLVLAAVQEGRVGAEQARVLTRLVGKVSSEQLVVSQEAMIEVATRFDPEQLAAWVRHLIATWCEPQHEHDDRTAQHKRFLQTRRNGDGTSRGSFVLPDEDMEGVLTVLEPLARVTGLDDTRSAGQRRADALVEVFDLALRHGDLPAAGGARPQLSYVVPAGWAAGDCPPPFADLVCASLPGVPGVPVEQLCATGVWTGPQTRARIEAMLCDARISRVLLSPAGQVIGLEALTDTITKAQRRALVARDHGCAARGCTRPPAFCDAHHLTHLADGGETTLENLALLCRRHHILWHQGRLRLRDLHVPWIDTIGRTGAGPPGEAA